MPIENPTDPTNPADVPWTSATSEYSLDNLRPSQEQVCDVTEDAVDQMEKWGLSSYDIEKLAKLSAQFQYDDCLNKAEQIAQRGGIITKDRYGEGEEGIVLPDLFDLGDRTGGQCIEIAAKVIKAMHSEGWLNEVNEANEAAGRDRLYPYYLTGQSRTHFNGEGSTHVWAGLAPGNAKPEDIITIDGSFLEISCQATNEYQPRKIIQNPGGITRSSNFLLRLGDLVDDEESWSASLKDSAVIGVTDDRSLVICLAFVKDRSLDEDQIHPLIQLIAENGTSSALCVRLKRGVDWADNEEIADENTRSEIVRVLEAAEAINFTEDRELGSTYKTNKTTAQYY